MHAFMAAALATGVVVAGGVTPVNAVGDAKWNKYGEHGSFSVDFVGDDVVFTTTAEDAASKGVDMQLRRITVAPLSKYADAAIEGDNAHLALEGMVKAGDAAARYTSIVFSTSTPDEVQLTWGSDPDTFVSTDDFFAGVADGFYSGTIAIERVGHTNTADKNGEVARVDEVTLRGETFDFGQAMKTIYVEALGQEGWQLGGNGGFDLSWTPAGVEFRSASGPVDMRLQRGAVKPIDTYRDAQVVGKNAFFTVEGLFTKPGTRIPTYTSVVFSSDNPDQVILTWGKAADEYLTMDQFQKRIDDGTMKGASYAESVGHTNTADTDGETALVDSVSFAGTTYDFRGIGAAEGEGPAGPVMPEVDAPAAEGEGPAGPVMPEVDAPAAEGEGPDGPVMPEVKPEDPKPEVVPPAAEGEGPAGPVMPEVTPEVDDEQTEGDGVDSEDDADDTQTDGELADTGAGGLAIALLGSTLLAAGGAATAVARRRG